MAGKVILLKEEMVAIDKVAVILGIQKSWLVGLIQNESSFDPNARNKTTNAFGLLQWTPPTMNEFFGVTQEIFRNIWPTREKQILHPVKLYLSCFKQFKLDDSGVSFFMSIFYPKYRNSPMDTQFPIGVRSRNPGIAYVRDYVGKCFKKINEVEGY